MKISGLNHNDCAAKPFERIKNRGHEVVLCTEKLTPKVNIGIAGFRNRQKRGDTRQKDYRIHAVVVPYEVQAA